MKLVPNSAPILLTKCGYVGACRPLRAESVLCQAPKERWASETLH